MRATRVLRRVARGGTVLAVLAHAGLAGCAVNPVTGERQLALISESQEIEMGRAAAQEVEQTLGLVDDDALQAYVQRLGAQLAAESERPDLPWRFRVVDDPTPNAFALPGGFIYFTRGMMNLMDSEAELAAVLGHEIGHVTARHSVTAISRQQLAQLGLGIGGIFVPEIAEYGQILGAGLQLAFLKHGRDAERQADDLGFRYALEAGYEVEEMGDVFLALSRLGELEQRSALPSWAATHPAPEERVEAVQRRIAALPSPPTGQRLGRAEYLGQIDGLVYGVNPRAGYFRQGVFLHPDLRFRFAVPQDWATQNLSQAVMAISPRRNAAVQLTLAEGTPEAALQQFGRQQGVQVARASRETINGVPAVVSQFQAQSQQTVMQGYVAFYAYGGRTYQVVAYTAAQLFAEYDRTFRQVVGSFAPLTDAAVLAVQPDVLDVERLDRAMTLAEFERRFPSRIPLRELVVINQVADENVTLPSGTLVKRVVAGPAGR